MIKPDGWGSFYTFKICGVQSYCTHVFQGATFGTFILNIYRILTRYCYLIKLIVDEGTFLLFNRTLNELPQHEINMALQMGYNNNNRNSVK